jgi:L-seryl-tRNA(Ser) seleniumtransferase
MPGDEQARLRALPAVQAVLERPALLELVEEHGRAAVVRAVRGALAEARAAIRRGSEGAQDPLSDERVAESLAAAQKSSLERVLNAAGVLVHTNLGRSPLAPAALEAVVEVARGYSSLEIDLEAGRRGSRHGHAAPLLVDLCGAEDAVVVNNGAAAVLLALCAVGKGREVVVSRGELVEIGGAFRIPDVMVQSGARLVEVGTTNRTRASDYETAIGPETALLMKVHRSNFALVGFTAEVSVAELAAVGRARGVPVLLDAGSGCLEPFVHDPAELPVRAALEAGADLVTFSGDKLLGGPQAGLIVGRRDLVDKARRHPLMRALRPDKMCLAALVSTLRLWRDDPKAIPLVAALRRSPAELEARACAMQAALAALELESLEVKVVATKARIGGGTSPLVELESRALALFAPGLDELAARLRRGRPPVVARIEDGALLLDLRAIAASEDEELLGALRAALEARDG